MIRRLAALALAALAACASHQKSGDRAAATGDWKAAERSYAAAVRDDPDSAELRAKWQQARAQALSTSVARAKACAAAADWECAYAESDYAVSLEPTSAELALTRRDAARNVGLQRVRRAEDAAQRREHRAGLELLASARDVTEDAQVRAEVKRVQPGLVRGAVEQAEGLRKAGDLPGAIALLGLAASADGSVAPRLEAAKAEYDRHCEAEYARLEKEGDVALAQGRWADAQGAFEGATRFRPGRRAATFGAYAGELRAGDAAVRSKDWAKATQAYQRAVKLGVERDGLASRELERVRVRPYAVHLRSLLVRPARPDGRPWVGERSRVFDAIMIGARAAERGWASDEPGTLRLAIDVANGVPAENQPTIVTTVDLAGRRVQTAPRRALYQAPDASVVFLANAYDDRLLSVRVTHVQGAPYDVGVVHVPIGELVSRGRVALRHESIARVELVAAPSDAKEGTLSGFFPEGAAPAAVPAVAPAPARKR